jgi:hypothetical protein
MSLFSYFRKDRPNASGSAEFQAFYRRYLSEEPDLEQARLGMAPDLIECLSPVERAEAERLLIARVVRGDDSRAAIGLVHLRSQAAVEPLRSAMLAQARLGPMASPAFAQALWQIARDARAIDAAAEIARDTKVHQFLRVQAVIALTDMPTPTALHTLQDLLQTAPESLIRNHCFKGLLLLHGYGTKEADDHTGRLAPDIAGAHLRPAARETMMARLAELLAGRTMVQDRGGA